MIVIIVILFPFWVILEFFSFFFFFSGFPEGNNPSRIVKQCKISKKKGNKTTILIMITIIFLKFNHLIIIFNHL